MTGLEGHLEAGGTGALSVIRFTVPVKTTNPLNGAQGRTRGAVFAKAAQRKKQREAARWAALCAAVPRAGLATLTGTREITQVILPPGIKTVTLTRVSAGTLDTDGLAASLKSIRDGLADYFGVGDGAEGPITWGYAQRKCKRGEYSVEVEIT